MDALDRATLLLRAGDHRGAAEAILRDHGPGIMGYLLSVLRNEDDASDVFSEFSLDLWRGLPGFRGDAPPRVWAYRLAWHAAARLLRDPFRRRGQHLETNEISRIADEVRSSVLLGRREAQQASIDRLRASKAARSRYRVTISSISDARPVKNTDSLNGSAASEWMNPGGCINVTLNGFGLVVCMCDLRPCRRVLRGRP